MNKIAKNKELRACLNRLNPDIAIILETRIKKHKVDNNMKRLGGNWMLMENYNEHANGRIG